MTFRRLETAAEHLCLACFAHYRWPRHALALPHEVLETICRGNPWERLSGR